MRNALKTIVAAILRFEAKLILRKYKPHIVAITGSVGKTSTKDAIFAVVASGAHARKSEKSFNSEIGLPLTILGRPNAWSNPLRWIENIFDGLILYLFTASYPEWLVLEVGADRPGDIRSLARWLKVDIAVITRLPEVPVHVEFFDSADAVKEEKASLINTLKENSALVLYADDPEVVKLRVRAPRAQIVTFGFSSDADIEAREVKMLFDHNARPVGMQAQIRADLKDAMLEIRGAIGGHALLPALGALGVGRALGKTLEASIEALAHYDPPKGRMRVIEGEKNTTIIDDTYNSSPAAVVAALDTLALVPRRGEGRRIAALGDMLELGRVSVEEHRKAGAYAAKTADFLITVGFRARDIAQGALDAGMSEATILQFEDARGAAKALEAGLREGDIVLVKGSQSMRMERIVEEIMALPEHAADLLVRQEEEWKRKA